MNPSSSSSGPASAPPPPPPRKQHCWECLRRRLVCDGTRPACQRCRAAAIVCPGFEDRQPLRWVRPGQVSAAARGRGRKKKKKEEEPAGGGGGSGGGSGGNGSGGAGCSSSIQPVAAAGAASDALDTFGPAQERMLDALLRFELWDENRSAIQASYYYSVEMYESASPLRRLLPAARVALPAPAPYRVLPKPLRCLFVSLAMAHHLLSSSSSSSSQVKEEKAAVVRAAWALVRTWNGRALRSLNELLASVEAVQISDQAITSVYILMYTDMQQFPSTTWRTHFGALAQMVALRGGLAALWRAAPHMRYLLLGVVFTEVFGNATSPAADQLARFTRPPTRRLFFRACYADGVFPVYMGSLCPPPLLFLVVEVSALRARAVRAVRDVDDSPPAGGREEEEEDEHEAADLLRQALAFSPEDLASSRVGADDDAGEADGFRERWELLGRIYQSAVVLYCALALGDLGLFPSPSSSSSSKASSSSLSTRPSSADATTTTTPDLAATRRRHYDRLLLDLKTALRDRRLRSPCAWPLVVAGVRARAGSPFERAFVEDSLDALARGLGSRAPWLARQVLRAFWEAPGRDVGWEACFQAPYLFIA
ncbi:hypothetical protein F4780DRAFT_780918 [Xylariomycetidae sp. FL0641]|nr:hypothetical protein F4780DRAFT_780918 [Xylariomycetidae sp. FL0641]